MMWKVFRQMRFRMNEQYRGLGLEAFFEMTLEIAVKTFREVEDPGEALELLCETFNDP